MPITERSEVARAFNLGCQARLDGKPLSDCPYGGLTESGCDYRELKFHWRLGWKDVDQYWGTNSRAQPRSLPTVQEVVAS